MNNNRGAGLILPKQIVAQQNFDRVSKVDVPPNLMRDAIDTAFTAVMAIRRFSRMSEDDNVRVVRNAIEQTMNGVGGMTPELLVALNWRVICFGNILDSLTRGLMDTQWLHRHMGQRPSPGGMQWSVTDEIIAAIARAKLGYREKRVSLDMADMRAMLDKEEKESGDNN